jgi:hypothetical protein
MNKSMKTAVDNILSQAHENRCEESLIDSNFHRFDLFLETQSKLLFSTLVIRKRKIMNLFIKIEILLQLIGDVNTRLVYDQL